MFLHLSFSLYFSVLVTERKQKREIKMAEEEAPLAYIPEVILKKRKSNEEWALKRKAQYEDRQSALKKKAKQEFIRMPEDFIKQYRTRVSALSPFFYLSIYLYVFVCGFVLLFHKWVLLDCYSCFVLCVVYVGFNSSLILCLQD